MTIIIDSKQLSSTGSTGLSTNAVGTAALQKNVIQLSDESLGVVMKNIGDTPATLAIKQAQDRGTLIKAVAYVDKTTGQLKIVPVNVPNAK